MVLTISLAFGVFVLTTLAWDAGRRHERTQRQSRLANDAALIALGRRGRFVKKLKVGWL